MLTGVWLNDSFVTVLPAVSRTQWTRQCSCCNESSYFPEGISHLETKMGKQKPPNKSNKYLFPAILTKINVL